MALLLAASECMPTRFPCLNHNYKMATEQHDMNSPNYLNLKNRLIIMFIFFIVLIPFMLPQDIHHKLFINVSLYIGALIPTIIISLLVWWITFKFYIFKISIIILSALTFSYLLFFENVTQEIYRMRVQIWIKFQGEQIIKDDIAKFEERLIQDEKIRSRNCYNGYMKDNYCYVLDIPSPAEKESGEITSGYRYPFIPFKRPERLNFKDYVLEKDMRKNY